MGLKKILRSPVSREIFYAKKWYIPLLQHASYMLLFQIRIMFCRDFAVC